MRSPSCWCSGIASGAVALFAAGQLAALWLSELGIFWVWELLTLVIIATVVGLATLPSLLDRSRPLSERLLGPPTLHRLMAVALGRRAARRRGAGAGQPRARAAGGGAHYHAVAAESGALFAVLLLALALLDGRRAASPR